MPTKTPDYFLSVTVKLNLAVNFSSLFHLFMFVSKLQPPCLYNFVLKSVKTAKKVSLIYKQRQLMTTEDVFVSKGRPGKN